MANRSSRRKWTDEQLIIAVKDAHSVAGVLRSLNLRPVGGNYKTANKIISDLNLDTSHFTGKHWNRGKKFGYSPIVSTEEMLQDGTHHHSMTIKNRLFRDGIKLKNCEMCSLSEWLGLPIALELDHINGVNNDNRLENLRILCPNCHATTPTYRGRNQERAKTKASNSSTRRSSTTDVRYRKPRKKIPPKQCVDCSKHISRKTKTGRCELCSHRITERIKWPCNCKLSAMISESNFLQTGKTLGVSDNAVRKRLKNHPTCECTLMIDN